MPVFKVNGAQVVLSFSDCECIEISCVCLPSHPCWCWINCTKMKINRLHSADHQQVKGIHPAPLLGTSGTHQQCWVQLWLPVQGGDILVQKRPWHWGCSPTGGGGGRKRKIKILCCLQIPNGVRTEQCQPLQGCPEKVQESGGKCQECVGKMFLEGLVWQQGSRGAVELLPWQILMN